MENVKEMTEAINGLVELKTVVGTKVREANAEAAAAREAVETLQEELEATKVAKTEATELQEAKELKQRVEELQEELELTHSVNAAKRAKAIEAIELAVQDVFRKHTAVSSQYYTFAEAAKRSVSLNTLEADNEVLRELGSKINNAHTYAANVLRQFGIVEERASVYRSGSMQQHLSQTGVHTDLKEVFNQQR